MFLFQMFVNSAMAMGIAPITGIPLPFVSVGGSAMLTNFFAVGVLQAIHMRRNVRRR
jgi:rod shape determining protein RodA